MIKVFVLIVSMSNGYQGSAIDNIEFDLYKDCEAAGQAFVKKNEHWDHSRYVCVTKNKVQK